MKENLMVSTKGQITLPAAMRRALGLRDNAIVTAEQLGGRIVLTPAMVVETEIYPDADVEAWRQSDTLTKRVREDLTRKLKKATRGTAR